MCRILLYVMAIHICIYIYIYIYIYITSSKILQNCYSGTNTIFHSFNDIFLEGPKLSIIRLSPVMKELSWQLSGCSDRLSRPVLTLREKQQNANRVHKTAGPKIRTKYVFGIVSTFQPLPWIYNMSVNIK